MRFGTNILIILFSIIAILTNSHCTFAGYGLGGLYDASQNEIFYGIDPDLSIIAPGSKIQIRTRDDRTFDGEFVKISFNFNSTYERKYQKYYLINEETINIPALFDTITIHSANKYSDKLFLGFGFSDIFLKSILTDDSIHIAFSNKLSIIKSNGDSLNIDDIKNEIYIQELPILSGIIVESENQITFVSLNDIYTIQIFESNLASVGTILGAVIDLTIIYHFPFPSKFN